MGTDANLHTLLTTWHTSTHYNLMFQGETFNIKVGRGLRQGCREAPLLWVIIGPEWIQQTITLYADDLHVGCCFTDSTTFQQALINLGHVLDVLEEMTFMATAGTDSRNALRGHVQRHLEGTSLLIPRSNGQKTALPLRKQATYLGTILTYRSFEECTWRHRRKAAWTAFHRLKPWLRCTQVTMKHKIYLWQASIHSISAPFQSNLAIHCGVGQATSWPARSFEKGGGAGAGEIHCPSPIGLHQPAALPMHQSLPVTPLPREGE